MNLNACTQNLITSPASILMQACGRFQHLSKQSIERCYKIIGWDWGSRFLSAVLDDYSRLIAYWERHDTRKHSARQNDGIAR